MNTPLTSFDPLDLEVAPGLRVRDLSSRAQCDEAMLRIAMDMESIVAQIGRAEEDPTLAAPGWRTKAQSAIRWKKRTKAAVHQFAQTFDPAPAPTAVTAKRKAIIDTFKDELGADEFERIIAVAKARHPAAFAGREAIDE